MYTNKYITNRFEVKIVEYKVYKLTCERYVL